MQKTNATPDRPNRHCPHSVANFTEAIVERLEVDLTVDFTRQVFFGKCDLKVKVLKPTKYVYLDVLALNVWEVKDSISGSDLEWSILRPEGAKADFGSCLAVGLPDGSKSITLRVEYETTDKSTAILWMTPEMTKGKRHPFCFTQSQAICGRSLIPCQDTPCVKHQFVIRLTVPEPLVAIASGIKVSEENANGQKTFTYKQDVPVMSYLLACVIGDIAERKIGPRSVVYAEPEIVEAAQAEYETIVEEMLVAAQKMVGGSEYLWGSYNLAILPSSFGYGGMENPNCTFMSASLIAGDRSLTTTLAHEIVHSWTGNLVTNAFHKDFWLNEGFTRYIERRCLGYLYGDAFRGLLLTCGYGDLKGSIELLKATPNLTCLEPSIDDVDPDSAFSRVPYEKGSLFLFYLEQVVGGGDKMTDWLRSYVDAFRNKSIETKNMKEHFCTFFGSNPKITEIDWDHWIKGEGLPNFDLAKHVDDSLLLGAYDLAGRWLKGGSGCQADDLKGWKAQQIFVFLDKLINSTDSGQPPSHGSLASMGKLYNFPKTRNVEIFLRWCTLGCKCKWPGILDDTDRFLSEHGRGIYVKTLYNAYYAFEPSRARATYERNKDFYMRIIAKQIAKIIKL